MSEIKTILKIKRFPLDHSKSTYDYDDITVNFTDTHIIMFTKVVIAETWGGGFSMNSF